MPGLVWGEGPALGHRLSKDVGLRLLSVLLASVLWVQATAVQNPVDRFTFDAVPVVAGGMPADMVVAGSLHPAKVNITVKCRRRVAEKLTAADFRATVSLEGGRAGSADYPVEIEKPGIVDIVEISPAAVTVTLERAASAKVPIEVRLGGFGADGYAAGTPVLTPMEVVASGPSSAVSRVVKAVAEFDVSSATSDVSGKAGLVAVDGSGVVVAEISLAPPEVVVTVPVVALPAAESVDVDVSLTGSPGQGFAVLGITCTPTRVQVRPLPGGIIDFDHIMTAPVDIGGATSDVRSTVSLIAPSGVATVTPNTVEVVVEIGATRTLLGIGVEIRNLVPGLKATTSPVVVDVVVRGPRALLDRLVAVDIVTWVDATGRGLGQAEAMVEASLPEWAGELEVTAVIPSDVNLVVTR